MIEPTNEECMEALVLFATEKCSIAELGIRWQGKNQVLRMLRRAILLMYETGKQQHTAIGILIKRYESNRNIINQRKLSDKRMIITFTLDEVEKMLGIMPNLPRFDAEAIQ